MNIIIDGKKVTANLNETIFEVAKANSITIPTLCHDPSLEPAAMCRICTVIIKEGNRERMVTSCNYPLRRDAEIQTDTDELRINRKLIIELLLARCSPSGKLKKLAEEYNVDICRFTSKDLNCIVCGLCVRVCEKIGSNVLSLSGRGIQIKVSTPFENISKMCIGCGACEQICPVDKISIKDIDGIRYVLHGKEEISHVQLLKCTSCGKYFGPVLDLNKVMNRIGQSGITPPNLTVCSYCARRNLAGRIGERYFEKLNS